MPNDSHCSDKTLVLLKRRHCYVVNVPQSRVVGYNSQPCVFPWSSAVSGTSEVLPWVGSSPNGSYASENLRGYFMFAEPSTFCAYDKRQNLSTGQFYLGYANTNNICQMSAMTYSIETTKSRQIDFLENMTYLELGKSSGTSLIFIRRTMWCCESIHSFLSKIVIGV